LFWQQAPPGEAIYLGGKSEYRIDLLITDMLMPEINGLELVERLKKTRPEMKCLYMSGYMANIIARHGVLKEGVHFIQKPFSRNELATKVRKALEDYFDTLQMVL
jgi:two-component system, cell cycle sensor histidine kinase and response regulator CckA